MKDRVVNHSSKTIDMVRVKDAGTGSLSAVGRISLVLIGAKWGPAMG